jgi:hypothetical protein
MTPFDEKPFRSEADEKEPAEVHVRIGHPRVRPHVVNTAGPEGAAAPNFVTSFLVAWQPSPTPPAHWIELLRQSPFGTQTVRAGALHWDGHVLSIELVNEGDIEAYAVEMPGWVEFANAEFGRRVHTPAEEALASAQRRAEALENRLRK